MSAPAFAALAFAWDEMLTQDERDALLSLAGLTNALRGKLWRDLSPATRMEVIKGARHAIALGQTCAQLTLVDIEREFGSRVGRTSG